MKMNWKKDMKSKKKQRTENKEIILNNVKFKERSKHKNHSDVPKKVTEYSQNWKAFLQMQASKTSRDNHEKKAKHIEQKKTHSSSKSQKKIKDSKKSTTEQPQNNKDIWFDDVDPLLLEKECGVKLSRKVSPAKNGDSGNVSTEQNIVTKFVGLDCEMVGIGFEGKENALARVSIVNSHGACVYDKYVKPAEKVVDYRTHVSGIRASDLKDAPTFETVQKEISDLLRNRILVGHALHNDLKVLLLGHSRKQIRDTAKYKPFHKLLQTKRPALRKLAEIILKETIQTGEHSSVVDARAAMMIYKKFSKEWEKSLRTKTKPSDINMLFIGKDDVIKKKTNKWARRKEKRKKKDKEFHFENVK